MNKPKKHRWYEMGGGDSNNKAQSVNVAEQ